MLAQFGQAHFTFLLLGIWLFVLPFLYGEPGSMSLLLTTSLSALFYGWCAYRVQQRYNALENASFTDPLTGLANRRAFEWRLRTELEAMRRHKKPLAVLALDVDLLKAINDKLGHPGGDRALRMVADSIRQVSRAADLPSRLGGDEFAVLAPQTSAEEAAIMARRVQDTLRSLSQELPGGLSMSASAGISSTEMESCKDAPGLMKMADLALYEAKHRGRDQLAIGQSSALARSKWQAAQHTR